jgi:hypothetical protein
MVIFTFLLFGCSSGVDAPVIPDPIPVSNQAQSNNGRIIWGVYKLAFSPDDDTVLVLPNRELEKHFNVTEFVKPPYCGDCVKVVGSYKNPPAKEWTIGVMLKNPTIMAGRDVRGLVRNVGNKWLKNADGYMNIYYMQDMSFKAFAKLDPKRVFYPLTEDQQNYVFHFPPGSNWMFIDYIVDTSWPGNCQEPIIENISFPTEIDNGPIDTPLTVTAFDHQADQGDIFAVLADLSPIGGDPNTILNDDGQSGDGDAEDGVYGVKDIIANAPSGEYTIRIWAFDLGGHNGFNSFRVTLAGSTNDDPIIDEITASRTTCLRNSNIEKVTLQCIAHDPNLDELEYEWSADAGTFDDKYSPTTTWKAPSTVDKYYITCTVTDGKGGFAEGQSPKIRVTKYEVLGPAPNFTCQRNLNSTSFKLSDYCPDRVVLQNFWATT